MNTPLTTFLNLFMYYYYYIISDLIAEDDRTSFLNQYFNDDDCKIIEVISLRCFALIHQVISGLWPRNFDLTFITPNYYGCYYCESTIMQYLSSLQNISMKIPINELLSTLLKIYKNNYMFICDFNKENELFPSISFKSFLLNESKYDNVDLGRHTQLALLQLYLIGAIMRGDGYHTKYSDETIKRYISTWIACIPSKFSSISSYIPQKIVEDPRCREIIYELCDHISTGNGYFKIKPESWKYVDPFLSNIALSEVSLINTQYLVLNIFF